VRAIRRFTHSGLTRGLEEDRSRKPRCCIRLDSWSALASISSDEPAYNRVEALLEQDPLMVGRPKSARPIPRLTGDPEILAQSDLPCAVESPRPHPA
jgi:hypothetical protein